MNFLPVFCFFALFLIVACQENRDAETINVENPGQESAVPQPPKSPGKRSAYYGGYGYGGYGGYGYGYPYGSYYGGYGGYYPYYGGYGWGGYGWGYPYGTYGYFW